MSTVRSVSAALAAIALASVPVVVSASDKGASPQDPASTPSAQNTQFAALKSVKAVPMSSNELQAVKGLHFHFTTPSGKELLVNIKIGLDTTPPTPTPNPDPSSTFPFIVGKGYRGLCGRR